jgi:predicted oxidoreductase
MEKIMLGVSGLSVPPVAVGCMRIGGMDRKTAEEFVSSSLELGFNFFDHADIYGGGKCEEVFGNVLKTDSSMRDKIFIQTKCGIRSGMYDFSKEHILKAVDGSLKRLSTDYIDVLLLHRPDTLMEPEEVAEAFAKLKSEGKVNHFGVSNQKPGQMELLAKYLGTPIVANQLQFAPTNTGMVDTGFNVNTAFNGAIDRDGSVLEYCRLKDITIQAWSPYQYGFFEGAYIGSDKWPELNKALDAVAEKYGITSTGAVASFILRHPAKMMVVTGTTKPSRLAEIKAGTDIRITREEWYNIYLSAGNRLP